jgi:hypothetical protein
MADGLGGKVVNGERERKQRWYPECPVKLESEGCLVRKNGVKGG